jgi:hypothetical protein
MLADVSAPGAALWPEPPGRLYAVLDAARDPSIHAALRDIACVDEVASLYEGDAASALADAAPYLVALDPDGAAFDWLWHDPVRRGFAVYVSSDAAFADLRAHLRRLTRVRDEDGRVLLFRFYDPLVLRIFLPSCDAEQLASFFGPIERIMLADRGALIGFRLRGQMLESEDITEA